MLTDLEGNETPSPLGLGSYEMPRFSPDGRYIAYDEGGDQVRLWDRSSGANPVLAGGADIDYIAWPRGSEYVYYSSNRAGTTNRDAFRRRADLSAEEEQLFRRPQDQFPVSASPDGTSLLVLESTLDRGWDLLTVTGAPDSASFTNYLVAPWSEVMGTISPDGERAAYVSDESDVAEVYVRSFPGAENQVRVSDGGGTEPVWAPDGSGIYYRNGSELWRADLADGVVTGRRMLFTGSWATLSAPMTNWDVHPNGDRFVFVRDPNAGAGGEGPPALELEVVVNWFDELRQRLGS